MTEEEVTAMDDRIAQYEEAAKAIITKARERLMKLQSQAKKA